MGRTGNLLRQASRAVASAAAAAALAAGLVAAVVVVLGGSPTAALGALWSGSVGTPASLAETLLKSTPLLLTGLSVAVAFRAGLWNIGSEGQFLLGMLGSAVAALLLPPLPPFLAVPACVAAGALAGAGWAAAAALLKIRREVPEVISTIMLNFLAVYLIEYLVRGPLKDPGSVSEWSALLPDRTHLPRLDRLLRVDAVGWGAVALPDGSPVLALGIEAGRLHLGVLLALAAVPAVWLWLARTATGFQLQVVGQNPVAARAAGIATDRTVWIAFLTSGALAGLAGSIEILGLIQRLYRYAPGSPGYGFSGIAVALLGHLHPVGVLAAGQFFGALSAGCSQMQRTAGVSAHVAYVVQSVLVLLLLVLPRLGKRLLPGGSGSPGDAREDG